MQMLLVDTNEVVMYLINQAKRRSAEDLKYAYSRMHREVSMRINENFGDHWTATITVDNENEHKFPSGTVVLKKMDARKSEVFSLATERRFFLNTREISVHAFTKDKNCRMYRNCSKRHCRI